MKLPLTTLCIAAALVLAACGGSGGDSASPTGAAPSPTASAGPGGPSPTASAGPGGPSPTATPAESPTPTSEPTHLAETGSDPPTPLYPYAAPASFPDFEVRFSSADFDDTEYKTIFRHEYRVNDKLLDIETYYASAMELPAYQWRPLDWFGTNLLRRGVYVRDNEAFAAWIGLVQSPETAPDTILVIEVAEKK